jgi:benzoate 4-monooxygenase
MAFLSIFDSPVAVAGLFIAAGFSYYLYPYFVTYGSLRRVPAPFPAQFTDWWLLSTARRGRRYEIVDKVHQKLGPVVRIAPNHFSVNDDDAIQTIYGHGNGLLKS